MSYKIHCHLGWVFHFQISKPYVLSLSLIQTSSFPFIFVLPLITWTLSTYCCSLNGRSPLTTNFTLGHWWRGLVLETLIGDNNFAKHTLCLSFECRKNQFLHCSWFGANLLVLKNKDFIIISRAISGIQLWDAGNNFWNVRLMDDAKGSVVSGYFGNSKESVLVTRGIGNSKSLVF